LTEYYYEHLFQKVCAASQKKCLSGLDSMASEGSSAFDSIEDAVRTVGSLGKPYMSQRYVQQSRQIPFSCHYDCILRFNKY